MVLKYWDGNKIKKREEEFEVTVQNTIAKEGNCIHNDGEKAKNVSVPGMRYLIISNIYEPSNQGDSRGEDGYQYSTYFINQVEANTEAKIINFHIDYNKFRFF